MSIINVVLSLVLMFLMLEDIVGYPSRNGRRSYRRNPRGYGLWKPEKTECPAKLRSFGRHAYSKPDKWSFVFEIDFPVFNLATFNFKLKDYLDLSRSDFHRTESEIDDAIQDAINFFNERFGVDFTDITPTAFRAMNGRVTKFNSSVTLLPITTSDAKDDNAGFKILSESNSNFARTFARQSVTDIGLYLFFQKPFTSNNGQKFQPLYFVGHGNTWIPGCDINIAYKSKHPIGSIAGNFPEERVTVYAFDLHTDYFCLGDGVGDGVNARRLKEPLTLKGHYVYAFERDPNKLCNNRVGRKFY